MTRNGLYRKVFTAQDVGQVSSEPILIAFFSDARNFRPYDSDVVISGDLEYEIGTFDNLGATIGTLNRG